MVSSQLDSHARLAFMYKIVSSSAIVHEICDINFHHLLPTVIGKITEMSFKYDYNRRAVTHPYLSKSVGLFFSNTVATLVTIP